MMLGRACRTNPAYDDTHPKLSAPGAPELELPVRLVAMDAARHDDLPEQDLTFSELTPGPHAVDDTHSGTDDLDMEIERELTQFRSRRLADRIAEALYESA